MKNPNEWEPSIDIFAYKWCICTACNQVGTSQMQRPAKVLIILLVKHKQQLEFAKKKGGKIQ